MSHSTNSLVSKRVFALPACLLAGGLAASALLINQRTAHAAQEPASPPHLAVAPAVSLPTSLSEIARQVGPAVVNINTETLPHPDAHRKARPEAQQEDEEGGRAQSPDGMQQFFQQFFGGRPGGGGPPEGQAQGEQRALGSGFIVDPAGYIVTNNHVIDKADRIFVKLITDPENDPGHPAKVIGVDKDTDLAVIKIDVDHRLPTVTLGNSDGAQVGDSVEAIGSPFDLSQTVTAGIVSAKNRMIEGGPGGQFKHYIQTDAAINPGNSGGPLLNMKGQVVGVNTAIYTESNGYMGIGFALPSNTVAEVYNQLTGPGHRVVRGSIGISFQPQVSSAVARMYGADAGVLVAGVTPGKAADRAGLKRDDVIVSVDGQAVENGDALVAEITPRKPGSTVTLGYLRDGKRFTAECRVEDRSELTEVASKDADEGPASAAANPGRAKLGLDVSDLPANSEKDAQGVVVRSVKPGSFAGELTPPVGPGVVIEALNRKPVHNKAEFDALVSQLKPGSDVVLQVVYPDAGSGQSTLTGGTLQ